MYVIHNTPRSNIDAVVQSLKVAVDKAQVVKDVAGDKETCNQCYTQRQTNSESTNLVAELTSVSFAAQMQSV